VTKGLSGRDRLSHKFVFELRYDYGFTYLDRCGRIVNYILKTWPEWMLANTSPNPQNAPLLSIQNNCRFNFSARKLDFSVEQTIGEPSLSEEDRDSFIVQVDELTRFLIRELDLSEFSRIGFRTWYLVPARDEADAEQWLKDQEFFTISKGFLSLFPEGKQKAASIAVIVEADDRHYRVALNSIERTISLELGDNVLNIPAHSLPKNQRDHLIKQIKEKKRRQHNPQFAAMVDIDAYQEDPKIVEPASFLKSCLKQHESFFTQRIPDKE
jgi:hypothetical protein